MRLTCPNCGAQYEVPDEVIPYDGRDVQCSNCGDTWFQGHPDNPDTLSDPESELETEPVAEPQSAAAKPEAEPEVEPDAEPEVEAEQEPTPQPEPEPEPEFTSDDADPPEAPPQPERPSPDIDSGITDILRQEAQRETSLRAAEHDPLESQPDLGLDAVGDAPSQRSAQARSRMARLRGEAPNPESEASSRRELLPDIEEINSAWNASDADKSASTELGPVAEEAKKQRGGFVRGFAMILIIGVLMALLYGNAPRIAQMLPAAEPALNSYVAMIDQGRSWLDARLGDMVPAPRE